MVTVDLGVPPPAPTSLLDGLPRRLPLTLPELRLAAERAGGAPLPFEPTASAPAATPLEARLGETRSSTEDAAYAATLAGLQDPAGSLQRRGLLVDGHLDPALAGAIGLLATPSVAVDLDVVVDGVQVKSWHRQHDRGVAALSTADGIVFEIAWLLTSQWGEELGRVAALPRDLPLRASGVPASLELPFELLDAAGEALHSGRGDLVPVLSAQHAGAVVADGRPLSDADVAGLLQILGRETRGRLRALVADVSQGAPDVVGVVSWLLLADGWHALDTRDDQRVRLRAVAPDDLAGALAPVVAEVSA